MATKISNWWSQALCLDLLVKWDPGSAAPQSWEQALPSWAWLWGPTPPLQKRTFDLFCVLRSTDRNSLEMYLLWWFKKTQKDTGSCVGGVWKQLSRADLPIQPCVCHELTPQTSPAVRGNGISFTQQGLGSFSLWGTSSLSSPVALGASALPVLWVTTLAYLLSYRDQQHPRQWFLGAW